VVLNDLQKASGEYLAEKLRCEGALVTVFEQYHVMNCSIANL
jgi:hypothetical protein